MHVVAKLIAKRLQNNFESVSFIVGNQVFHVFQKKCGRPFCGDNPGDIKKQRSLGSTFKSVFPTEGILFAYAGYGKWLTRESCQQNVVIWNIFRWHLSDVTIDLMFLSKIFRVRFYRPWIPFARKNAFSTGFFESNPNSAYSGKQINEGEIRIGIFYIIFSKGLFKCRND
jgi:hypothetical protein